MDSTNKVLLISQLSVILEGVQSVEILPGNLDDWTSMEVQTDAKKPSPEFPFVLIEGNLGIPKKIIYALYLVAISLPWRAGSTAMGTQETQIAISATAIILLVNPAHQTALNARKRLIQHNLIDVSRELKLIELFQRGSPECAKQSIIWDHRRWCLRHLRSSFGPISRPLRLTESSSTPPPRVSVPSSLVKPQTWSTIEEVNLFPNITPEDIRHEWELILHACETYPRNYHAWTHWHWLMDIIRAVILYGRTEIDLLDSQSLFDFGSLLSEAQTKLSRWVHLHPSDYTAIHHLMQYQVLINELVAAENLPANQFSEVSRLDDALALLKAFPNHESLWLYLRFALSMANCEHRLTASKKLSREYVSHPFFNKLKEWAAVYQIRLD